MVTKKVLLEFDITTEQHEKLDKLSEQWGLTEDDVIGKIIEIESASLDEKDKKLIIHTNRKKAQD